MKNLCYRASVGRTKTNEQKFTLNYYITEKTISIEGEKILTYGVSIIKNYLDERHFIRWEKETVNNIVLSKEEIYNFIKRLYENRVTPIHLLEIVEDYIIECEEKGIVCPLALKIVS